MKLLLPAAAFACMLWAADVSTDYDHHADFSKYHTYSWIGVKAGNSLWQDRIMAAVDSQLAAKGWTKSQGSGDASVSAFGKVTQQDTMQTFYDGFPGWGWRGWGGMGTATTQVIPENVGTLTVDIFDGSTKQLIWRGQAANTLSSKPEKNDKKLDDAVGDMFKKFPPSSKGE
ncbi:MAG TPA: DUF4136 domain-containing protein [Bryobacteraceae bacterium]|nr:DUF4136 domain-containing protein [Bryobacteraceae bacterium]